MDARAGRSLAAFNGTWANEARSRGATILVQSAVGKILHADEGLAAMLGRSHLPDSGFDMISAKTAAEAARMMEKNFGTPVRVWFPFLNDAGQQVWCRFEVAWPEGMIMNAIWLEDDAAKHRVHAEAM